jgi:uncharacterized protein (TIGR02246 family)
MSSAALTHDETSVRDVLDRMYRAWAAQDPDGIAELYLDDVTVVMPGVYRASSDEVRAYFAAGFAGPLKGSRACDEVRSIKFAAPDAAIVVSEGGVLMAGETTVPDARRVRATWVLARREGKWGIAAYHNSPLHAA